MLCAAKVIVIFLPCPLFDPFYCGQSTNKLANNDGMMDERRSRIGPARKTYIFHLNLCLFRSTG